jgi:hypothetical protein
VVFWSSGSQEERISILRMALAEKGIPINGHAAGVGAGQYQLTVGQEDTSQQHFVRQSAGTDLADAAAHVHDAVLDEDGGVDL